MSSRDLWNTVRKKAHVIFPVLGACVVAIVLASPLYPEPFAFVCRNAFARFCLFWCLAVCAVLSFANRLMRPSVVAFIATAAAVAVGAGFCVLFAAVAPEAFVISDVLFSCLAGAILGALAGTWLVYVLEVYAHQ